jgi:uncharacterized protein
MSLDPRLLAVLACPDDKGPLYFLGDDADDHVGGLYNPRLHRRYPVRDGIPVMLVDEAVAVSDADHAELMARIERDQIAPTFASPSEPTSEAGSEAGSESPSEAAAMPGDPATPSA